MSARDAVEGLRVLVVEDDEEDRMLLCRQLRAGGVDSSAIQEAGSLVEAEERLRRGSIDVIISDFHLGKATALDLFPLLRRAEVDAPVIVLTGADTEEAEEAVLGSEAVEFIRKQSLSREELRRTLRFTLRNHALVRELKQLAHYDALTGLVSRHLLMDRLESALCHGRRYRHGVAVLYLDLDDFKPVNDSFGHEAGDAVLKIVAQRLKGVVREVDTVARMGGDEFVVLMGNVGSEGVATVCERALASMGQPISHNGQEHQVGVSIGVRICSEGDYPDPPQVLAEADAALYAAKDQGGRCWIAHGRS